MARRLRASPRRAAPSGSPSSPRPPGAPRERRPSPGGRGGPRRPAPRGGGVPGRGGGGGKAGRGRVGGGGGEFSRVLFGSDRLSRRAACGRGVEGGPLEVVAKAVATKRLAISATPAGGTQEQAIEPERQDEPALTDAQAVRLAQLGRRIEAHFGRPQDIEWCLVDDGFQIVQSRPITTLFPIPAAGDRENHVYISVGHQQMMTDPMKPLGLSLFQLTAIPPMHEAGGRLFVDVTQRLASPTSRAGLLALAKSDPLIGDALQTIVDRDDFLPSLPDEGPAGPPPGGAPAPIETDPAIVTELIGHNQASVAALERTIRTKSGSALLDFILADIPEMKRILMDPRSHQVFMGAMEA